MTGPQNPLIAKCAMNGAQPEENGSDDWATCPKSFNWVRTARLESRPYVGFSLHPHPATGPRSPAARSEM